MQISLTSLKVNGEAATVGTGLIPLGAFMLNIARRHSNFGLDVQTLGAKNGSSGLSITCSGRKKNGFQNKNQAS